MKPAQSSSSMVRRRSTDANSMPGARDTARSEPSGLDTADVALERGIQSHQQEALHNSLPVLSRMSQPQSQSQAVNHQIIEQLMHAEERMRIFHQEDILQHEPIVMNLTTRLNELIQEDQGSTMRIEELERQRNMLRSAVEHVNLVHQSSK